MLSAARDSKRSPDTGDVLVQIMLVAGLATAEFGVLLDRRVSRVQRELGSDFIRTQSFNRASGYPRPESAFVSSGSRGPARQVPVFDAAPNRQEVSSRHSPAFASFRCALKCSARVDGVSTW